LLYASHFLKFDTKDENIIFELINKNYNYGNGNGTIIDQVILDNKIITKIKIVNKKNKCSII